MSKLVRSTIMFCIVFSFILLNFGGAFAQDDTERQPVTADNAAQLVELMTITEVNVGSFAFVSDGIMVSVTDENGLRLFDVATGTLSEYLTSESLYRVTFSSDGTLVAGRTLSCSNGSCNSNVYVLDIETGGEILSLRMEGYVSDIEFSPDGERLAIGVSETHKETVGTQWTTVLDSGTVRLIELESDEENVIVTEEHGIYGELFFSSDGSRLAYSTMVWSSTGVSAREGSLHAVDLETEEKETLLQAGGFTNPPGGLTHAISADWTIAHIGGNIIWGNMMSIGHPPSVVNLESDEEIMILTEQDAHGIHAAFSLDSTLVFVAGKDLGLDGYDVSIRDLATGDEIATLDIENTDTVSSLLVSPDGTQLAVRWHDGEGQRLTIWGVLPE